MESYDIDGVIHLEIPDDEVRRRVLSRRLCPNCGMDYNLIADRPEVEGRCDICGHELVTRADDTPEALDARLRDYHEKTRPVLELFRRKESVYDVDARAGRSEVQATIRKQLGCRRTPPGLSASAAGTTAGCGQLPVVPAPLQLCLDRLAHRLDHGEPRVVLVVAGDDVPGRPGRVGALQHLVDRLLVLRPLLPVAPVLVGELPLRAAGRSARSSNRRSCSSGDTCIQNLTMIMPSATSVRSNSTISLYARDHCSLVANPSTRSTSTRPYQDRSNTAMPPQPGRFGQNRHRKWCRFSS